VNELRLEVAAGSARDLEDVLAAAARWREEGAGVSIATVIRTWGSSPRPVGSQLAVRADGAMVGSVSGGCVEAAVVREAVEVIVDGGPRRLSFSVADEQAWEVGLACGGTVEIYVERVE
jgi:xanthine/CO dehydrogenase XdhC/CoxF family maturation factor